MLTYRITEQNEADPNGRAAYVEAETSTQAAEHARQRLGFVNPRAASVDRNLVPEGAEVLVVSLNRRETVKLAPTESRLLRRPVVTISLGVFVGLLAFAVFVLCVSWLIGLVFGWPPMRKP